MWLTWTLLACLGFGVGAAMQKHGVSGALPKLTVRAVLREPGRVVRALFARPVWLAGVLANLLGGVGLVLAIDAGEVSVVQPLVNLNLLVAVLVGVVVLGERLRPVEWAGAVTMLAGAVLVSLSAGPDGAAAARMTADPEADVLLVTAVCLALVATLEALRRVAGDRIDTELAFGVAAGLLFGLGTAYIKLVSLDLAALPADRSTGALLAAVATDPAAWGVLAVNVVGFVLTQVAFANGRVAVVAPLVTISAMAMPVTTGVLAFGETLSALRIVGVAAVTVGIALLALLPASRSAPTRDGDASAAVEEPADGLRREGG